MGIPSNFKRGLIDLQHLYLQKEVEKEGKKELKRIRMPDLRVSYNNKTSTTCKNEHREHLVQ